MSVGHQRSGQEGGAYRRLLKESRAAHLQRCEQEENLPRVDGREPANESFAPPFPRINKNRCAVWSHQSLVLTQGLLLQLRRHNCREQPMHD